MAKSLYTDYTTSINGNSAFHFHVACVNDPDFVTSVLGMSHQLDRMSTQMSGGQKARANLISGMLKRPDILL